MVICPCSDIRISTSHESSDNEIIPTATQPRPTWNHKEITFQSPNPQHIWTIAEAKARLPEILRLADEQGPQRVGIRKTYVIVPEKDWKPNSTTAEPSKDRMPMGKWLVENTPRGTNLELPDRRETDHPNPFLEDTDR